MSFSRIPATGQIVPVTKTSRKTYIIAIHVRSLIPRSELLFLMTSSRDLEDVLLQPRDVHVGDAGVLQLLPADVVAHKLLGLVDTDVDGADLGRPDLQDPVHTGQVPTEPERARLHGCVERDVVGQDVAKLARVV